MSFQDGDFQSETIRFGTERMSIDSWVRKRTYDAFREFVGSGMNYHLQVLLPRLQLVLVLNPQLDLSWKFHKSFFFFLHLGKWIHQGRVWTGTSDTGWLGNNEGDENFPLWESKRASKLLNSKFRKDKKIFMFFFVFIVCSIFTTRLRSRLGQRPGASSGTRGWTWENSELSFVVLFVSSSVF